MCTTQMNKGYLGVGCMGVVREEPFPSYIVHESYKTWGINIVHYDTAVERNRLQH